MKKTPILVCLAVFFFTSLAQQLAKQLTFYLNTAGKALPPLHHYHEYM